MTCGKCGVNKSNIDWETLEEIIAGAWETATYEVDGTYGNIDDIIKSNTNPTKREAELREREIYYGKLLEFLFNIHLKNSEVYMKPSKTDKTVEEIKKLDNVVTFD